MGKRSLSRKEQEEQRKKEEEEAAAHAFQEFVETFQEAPATISKVWVKAGTYDAGSRREDHREKGKLYKPTAKISEDRSTAERAQEYARMLAGEQKKEDARKKKAQEKKKSNLELFKEELRQIQEEREERHKYKNVARSMLAAPEPDPIFKDAEMGSFDNGDPNTTNLYLGNLCPKISEQQLMELFGRFGPLASIKIMWPRSEEEKSRGRNCGFVAYMSRRDAERALKSLNGKDVMGYEMKLGWGKSVPILTHPIYIPPALVEYSMPPPPSGLPFNAQPISNDINIPKISSSDYVSSPELKSELDKVDPVVLMKSVIKVVIPTERPLLALIHRMIEFVIREGPLFEAMIMNREIDNPMFRFLFENDSPAHIYYRWKLFSLLQGDTPAEWRQEEFRMFIDGSIWKPPPVNFYTQGMPEELIADDESAEPSKGALSHAQRDRLEDLIRHLTPERSKIGDVMIFCIEHADAADEICECIAESLSNIETLAHKKIARLYLVSDILHNCSVKVQNASFFRKAMERNLLDMFKDLHSFYMSLESRLKAEGFKVRVLQVFRAWEDWAVYPRDFLSKLKNIFLGIPIVEERRDQDIDGAPISGDEKEDEDLDGVPLDGAALLKSALLRGIPEASSSSRGTPLQIQENSQDSEMDDDIDGIPLDDDIDGVPIERVQSLSRLKHQSGAGAFIPSKWETVDPEQIEAQAITTSKWDTLDPVAPEPPQISRDSDDSDDGFDNFETSRDMDEERRTRLREIELKTIQYQDELESGKRSLKAGWTIPQQLEHYRRKLMRKSIKDLRSQDNSDSASEKYSSSSREKRRSSSPTEPQRKSKKRRSPSPQYSRTSPLRTPRPLQRSRSPHSRKLPRESISPSRNIKSKRGRSRSSSDSPKRYKERSPSPLKTSSRYDGSPSRKYRSPSPRNSSRYVSSSPPRSSTRRSSPGRSTLRSGRSDSIRETSREVKSPPRHRSEKHKHKHKY